MSTPAHYYAIEVEGSHTEARKITRPSVALFACAAAAVLVLLAHFSTTQQTWAVSPSAIRAGSNTISPVQSTLRPAQGVLQAAASPQEPLQPSIVDTVYAPVQPAGKIQSAAWLGAATLLFGAAFSVASKLLRKEPEAMSLAASSSSKDKDTEAMRKVMNSLDMTDIQLLSRGGPISEATRSKGIDEVAAAIRADQASRKDLTPKDVILEMQRGNGRFWMGLSERPDMSMLERRALIMAQAPKIAVLSCSDSRVPVELIFDQGLGEIFVVRMAGNILDDHAQGSLEFGVLALGCKVVLVIGHEGCGAVKGAVAMSASDIAAEPADLQVVLNTIKNDLDLKDLSAISDGRARDREAIVRNTSNQVKKLLENPVFKNKQEDGSIMVAGAFYEISSGIVDFFSLDKNGLVVDL